MKKRKHRSHQPHLITPIKRGQIRRRSRRRVGGRKGRRKKRGEKREEGVKGKCRFYIVEATSQVGERRASIRRLGMKNRKTSKQPHLVTPIERPAQERQKEK